MMRRMKAAIFDMDGTLLDSMDEWRKLNVSLVREMGIEPTEEQEKEITRLNAKMEALEKEVKKFKRKIKK